MRQTYKFTISNLPSTTNTQHFKFRVVANNGTLCVDVSGSINSNQEYVERTGRLDVVQIGANESVDIGSIRFSNMMGQNDRRKFLGVTFDTVNFIDLGDFRLNDSKKDPDNFYGCDF